MHIPDWTPEQKPQPADLVDAVLARRGGKLLNLDRALLWSEPVARGWNHFLGAVRTRMALDARVRELAICTVALVTGADYEYGHHAPEYLQSGGAQADLDALRDWLSASQEPAKRESALERLRASSLGELAVLSVRYAEQITRHSRANAELVAALRQHLHPTAIVELTTAIAAYNMVARVLLALDVQPETRHD